MHPVICVHVLSLRRVWWKIEVLYFTRNLLIHCVANFWHWEILSENNEKISQGISMLHPFILFNIITKDLYSRKDMNLVLSRVAMFYATTEQKLIHSFWKAFRIRRKINQLLQSSFYASSYYTTQKILGFADIGSMEFFFSFCITPHTCKIKKSSFIHLKTYQKW